MLSSLSPPSLFAYLWHQGLEVASGKKHWDSDKPQNLTSLQEPPELELRQVLALMTFRDKKNNNIAHDNVLFFLKARGERIGKF